MFTEAILCIVFTSHMSVAAAFPWLVLQSMALRGLQTPPVEGQVDPKLRVLKGERSVSAAEAGSDLGASKKVPERRKAA